MLVLNDMTADARVDREATALAEAGHRVTVLALRGGALPPEEARNGFLIKRVAEHTTATWSQPWAKLSQLRSRAAALRDATIASSPDVVHAHDVDTLSAGFSAAKAAGARLVFDAHELYSDMISEHGMSGSWPVQAYWKRIERRLIPQADAVTTVSDALAEELRERHSVQPTVLLNVPSLEPRAESGRLRTEMGVDASVPIVLYQGGFIPGRALLRLVEAMEHVDGAVLALQGWGQLEDEMRSAAGRLGLGDRVRFLGKAKPADLHEYACGADVGVVIYEHTSLNNYLASPNKLFAYMMAGIPVASSDFPGLQSIVGEEGFGELFDPADAWSIAGAINRLVADGARRQTLGSQARGLAETRYNWDTEKLKLLELYERLAAASTS